MLDYVSLKDDGESSGAPARTILLLHGFGASMHDLAPLADAIDVPGATWFLPQAPMALPGYPAGRAWFPRTEAELETFATGVQFVQLRDYDPPGLAESAREVIELMRELGVPVPSTVIGGFSQGAMVAVEVILQSGVLPKALLLFSGSLISEQRWTRAANDRLSGLKVFQSHGKNDAVLPFAEAAALGSLLDQAGADRTFVEFPGAHTIPSTVVSQAASFVSSL
jgi:phospholipase/carboxylesterase